MNSPLLQQILQADALRIRVQPILEIHTSGRRLHGIECLSRGPEGTNLQRADILFSYVRKKHAEVAVDRACCAAALKNCASIHTKVPRISINVHAVTLAQDPQIVDFFESEANKNGIPLTKLSLEIVEHRPAWNGLDFRRTLEQFRQRGIGIVLDDIGLGSSNYGMIIDCRPSCFKLDKYFVHESESDFHRQAVIKSVVSLAESFGATVVAEGVEDFDDLESMLDIGVDLVQGFLVGMPMPVSELTKSGLLDGNVHAWEQDCGIPTNQSSLSNPKEKPSHHLKAKARHQSH